MPTVSILDGAGTVLVKQRVYPNNMLHAGSLAINAPGVGLSVWLALLDPAGAETGRVVQYVDFSETAPEGTWPIALFCLVGIPTVFKTIHAGYIGGAEG